MKIRCYVVLLNLLVLFNTGCSAEKIPTCDMILSESIPEDLTYDSSAKITTPISEIWSDLILNSNKTIKITSFYWTLLNNDVDPTNYHPSSKPGETIFNLLDSAAKTVALEVVQNQKNVQNDLKLLEKNALVKVYYINFTRLLNRGIQHSKVWIGDDSRTFIGSANMDWRSLTQVKELGIYIPDCKEIASETIKFWQSLKMLSGTNTTIPKQWPTWMYASYNHTHPFIANVNGVLMSIYIATSPPAFNPPYRTDDLTAILTTISRARQYICISVMDMYPLELGYSVQPDTFWPLIENALKSSAIDRNIHVKLMISWWRHSQYRMMEYLRSIKALSLVHDVNIEVKILIVPAFNEEQRDIPFSRVIYYSCKRCYIFNEGTSNWSGDYFDYSGGLSIITEELDTQMKSDKSIRTRLKMVFDIDWYSIYAHDLW